MLSKGRKYETLAEVFLAAHGHTLKAKNYHTRRGEIDLVMLDGQTLVFVEVRYRNNIQFGTPEETITHTKQTKIIYSAKHFMTKFNLWHLNARFDVITIKPSRTNKPEINWIKNAFN